MRQRKQNTIGELEKIRAAIAKLGEARELAKQARVSPRSIDRIRAAIKSLGGAERHASGSIMRAELGERRRELGRKETGLSSIDPILYNQKGEA